MSDIHTDLIDGPNVWTGDGLQTERRWEYVLEPHDCNELTSALIQVKDKRLEHIDNYQTRAQGIVIKSGKSVPPQVRGISHANLLHSVHILLERGGRRVLTDR